MPTFLPRIKNRFPAVHLVAASITTMIVGLSLLFLPSSEVSATKESASSNMPTHHRGNFADTNHSKERISNNLILHLPTANTSPFKHDTFNSTHTPNPHQEATPSHISDKNWVSYSVKKNDNLTTLFKRAGLDARDVYNISQATSDNKELSRLYPGESLAFLIEGTDLKKLKYEVNPLKTILIESINNEYRVKTVERIPETRERYVDGVIQDSLFADAERAGLSNSMIMQFASIFGWDIDFSQDIRQGDRFRVIYNEQFLEGEKIKDGYIVAAQFINNDNSFTAIRYTDSDGSSRYYTPDGQSMRKAFLRMPVDFARISSRFNLKRKHPILNRIRAHKGVDYAASTGTPIKASGDGKVIWKGNKGGYGRAIILQHGSNITTLYAHMSKYNSKLKQGSRVTQGQVIGYVGTSGLSSGPHLHYEFRVNGAHKNPMTVKLPHASPVPKKERAAFQQVALQMQSQLNTYAGTQYARAN